MSQSVFMRNWIVMFKVKVTAKFWNVNGCLSRWYLLNRITFCYQTWYCDAIPWARVHAKKICVLFSRSRSWQWLIWSTYDSFYYICWTADTLATKLALVVHHKPECLGKKWVCCVQGQGHSMIENENECLSKWYFMNRWTFYYQTWCVDASLSAILSSKKIGLLSSRSRSQWRII